MIMKAKEGNSFSMIEQQEFIRLIINVLLKEFEVVKINKNKKKKNRILGIDLYNLYNNPPKINEKSSKIIYKNIDKFKNIFFGSSKKTLKKIKDLQSCGYLSKNMFFIEIKNLDGINKQIIYEVKHVNTRNEIVSKIRYLIVRKIFIF